jgi:hypothetical protein
MSARPLQRLPRLGVARLYGVADSREATNVSSRSANVRTRLMVGTAFLRVTSRVSRPNVHLKRREKQQMSASVARLKHFGWGREGEGLSEDRQAAANLRSP